MILLLFHKFIDHWNGFERKVALDDQGEEARKHDCAEGVVGYRVDFEHVLGDGRHTEHGERDDGVERQLLELIVDREVLLTEEI